MKLISLAVCLFLAFSILGQSGNPHEYRKRVLETKEIDLMMSYYSQDGDHAAVNGGIGSEKLTNSTPTIVLRMPLNLDSYLTADIGISAYTSASSSNINPFDASGNLFGHDRYGDDDDDIEEGGYKGPAHPATPWLSSSGASRKDKLIYGKIGYTRYTPDRNTIFNGNVSLSKEYDYFSLGFGAGISKLWNDKNTELGLSTQVYLDKWDPIYPIEIRSFTKYNGDLSKGFFSDAMITGYPDYTLVPGFQYPDNAKRNSYSVSLSFSQVLSKKIQFALFSDLVHQKGMLATPYHRIYFKDRPDSFIEEFQLADDIERLPDSRWKIPLGMRMNVYLNEKLTFRSYYRYYQDSWDIGAHTASVETVFKLSNSFAIYPMYRYYTQTASKYFAPFESHISAETYYTSDSDLGEFHSHQLGFGIRYTDIFQKLHLNRLGLKSLDLRFNRYSRSDGLRANIVSLGISFSLN